MLKRIKWYGVPILGIGLSILLRIVSGTQFFDNYLRSVVKEDSLQSVKSIIDVLNHLVIVFPLGIQSILYAKKADKYKACISTFGQQYRDLLAHMLNEKGFIKGTCDDINIRVFKKHFSRLVLDEKVKICSRDINGKLSFSINKNEGLCTAAYNKKCSMLEVEDGSKPKFNLTDRQKALAGDLKFIVAVPIQSDSNDSIRMVICFDSFSKIAQVGCEEGILKICETVAYIVSASID